MDNLFDIGEYIHTQEIPRLYNYIHIIILCSIVCNVKLKNLDWFGESELKQKYSTMNKGIKNNEIGNRDITNTEITNSEMYCSKIE